MLGELGFAFPLTAFFDFNIHAPISNHLVRPAKAIHFSQFGAQDRNGLGAKLRDLLQPLDSWIVGHQLLQFCLQPNQIGLRML